VPPICKSTLFPTSTASPAGELSQQVIGPQPTLNTMNVIRPPTPSPPLARFSRAWFDSKYTPWKEQPATLKLIQVLLLMCSSIILLQYSWKFAWGLIYYFLEYSKAALGHDVLTEPCMRIMKEVYPWRDLKMSEYWRYMRCTGNEDGWERQGKLVPTPSGFLAWLFNPYAFSSWVVSCSSMSLAAERNKLTCIRELLS